MSIATSYQNYNHLWNTPPEWLSWVSETFLGRRYFDPCPANWDGKVDGLEIDWDLSVPTYVNNPGSRGSTQPWWQKSLPHARCGSLIWCAFNSEQPRHMHPSPYLVSGWLVMPRKRIGFMWGGPDIIVNEKAVEDGAVPKWRRHGDRAKSPGNWTVFWSSVEPAPTPEPCVIVRTGVSAH